MDQFLIFYHITGTVVAVRVAQVYVVANKSVNITVVVDVEEGRTLRKDIVWVVVLFVGSTIGISHYERNSIAATEKEVGMAILIKVSCTDTPRRRIVEAYRVEGM